MSNESAETNNNHLKRGGRYKILRLLILLGISKGPKKRIINDGYFLPERSSPISRNFDAHTKKSGALGERKERGGVERGRGRGLPTTNSREIGKDNLTKLQSQANIANYSKPFVNSSVEFHQPITANNNIHVLSTNVHNQNVNSTKKSILASTSKKAIITTTANATANKTTVTSNPIQEISKTLKEKEKDIAANSLQNMKKTDVLNTQFDQEVSKSPEDFHVDVDITSVKSRSSLAKNVSERSKSIKKFSQREAICNRMWCCWNHNWIVGRRILSVIFFIGGCLLVGFLASLYLRMIAYMSTGSFGYRIDRLILTEEYIGIGDLFITVFMAILIGVVVFLSKKAFKNWIVDLTTHHQFAVERAFIEEMDEERKYNNRNYSEDSDNYVTQSKKFYPPVTQSSSSSSSTISSSSSSSSETNDKNTISLEDISSRTKTDKLRRRGRNNTPGSLTLNILHKDQLYSVH